MTQKKQVLQDLQVFFLIFNCQTPGEKGNFYRKFLEQNLLFRYLIFMAGLFGILVFGVYGPDFAAGAFLYFQF